MKEYDLGRMPVIEYLQPGMNGTHADQFHLLACSGRENVYTDFHLSKKGFRAGDESLLHELLSTVDVVQAAPAESLDHFRAGSAPFLRGQYALAVPHYEEALALEQSHPTLDHAIWRLLVHNLATAYRLTGDWPRAMRILDYGLSKDPAYPLFHYNLARLHARMNDRNHAMQSLHAAFKSSRPNDNESLPDPRQDDCFRRVMLDPSFRALVDSLMQPAI
jgi:tetratricopeptide (TPR) repeat protein